MKSSNLNAEIKMLSIPAIQHLVSVVGDQMSKAVSDISDSSNPSLYFFHWYENTFDIVCASGYGEDYAELVAEYFAQQFDDHFGTTYSL